MQVLDAKPCLWLRRVTVLVMFVSYTASGECEIETFDLDKGRSIEITRSEDAEVSQRSDAEAIDPCVSIFSGRSRAFTGEEQICVVFSCIDPWTGNTIQAQLE